MHNQPLITWGQWFPLRKETRISVFKRPLKTSALLATALVITACGSADVIDPGGAAPDETVAKGDRGDDPTTPIARAISVLADIADNGDTDLQRDMARETVNRIQAGDVWIGAVDQARGEDLWHMCMDFMPAECGERPTSKKWAATKKIRETIFAELDGYQWGNRLYFTLPEDIDPKELAATLVHEVNHVLNRSECSYYKDFTTHKVDETYAFVEEFRAFYAECWLRRGVDASREACQEEAATTLVERDYGMTPDYEEIMPGELNPLDQIAEELLEYRFWEEGAFGYLVPTAAHWPRDFTPCD